MFPLYFPQIANEHIKYVLFLATYVAGEQLITSMKAQSHVARVTSLPSSTVDRSTREDNTIMLQNFIRTVYANSDSVFLFIMCGHYSLVVVWYNYHGT